MLPCCRIGAGLALFLSSVFLSASGCLYVCSFLVPSIRCCTMCLSLSLSPPSRRVLPPYMCCCCCCWLCCPGSMESTSSCRLSSPCTRFLAAPTMQSCWPPAAWALPSASPGPSSSRDRAKGPPKKRLKQRRPGKVIKRNLLLLLKDIARRSNQGGGQLLPISQGTMRRPRRQPQWWKHRWRLG